MTTPTHDESKQLRTSTGKFDGKIPTPPLASSELKRPAAPKTAAATEFTAAKARFWTAECTVFAAAENAIHEAVSNYDPEGKAVAVIFTPVNDYSGYDLSFTKLLDKDGNELEVEDSDAYDQLASDLDEMGDAITDSEYVESTYPNHGDAYRFELRPPAESRSPREAAADFNKVDKEIEALEARRAEFAKESLTLSVRERFPTASRVLLAFDGDGEMSAVKIVDQGRISVLGTGGLTEPGAYGRWERYSKYLETLNDYARHLDLDDAAMKFSTKAGADRELDLGRSKQ